MTALVLRGGTVVDPDAGTVGVRDVRIDAGRFSDDPPRPDDDVVDVAGRLVVPGLVDLHTHIFSGQDLGVDADEVLLPAGTTAVVDAGSAGAHLVGAFRRAAVERTRVTVRAFLNVASIGTTSILLGGELKAPYYTSEEAAVDAIDAHRDLVIGVKVRASNDVGGEYAVSALHTARRVADRVGLPLMVHLGPAPAPIDEIASLLGSGDILTHAFTGWPDNGLVVDGELRRSVAAARDRGALLDIGHGMSGFSLAVARQLVELGVWPDTISTDIHAYSRPLGVDFPTVLSKFLALGMPLLDVIERATVVPARIAGIERGGLRAGAVADLAVLERVAGPREFGDGFGGSVSADERLVCRMTVLGGSIVHGGSSRHVAGGQQ